MIQYSFLPFFQQRPVRVIGAVVAPGAYPITESQVPSDASLDNSLAGREPISRICTNQKSLRARNVFWSILLQKTLMAMLGPGDTLYVPLAEAKISVTGAVEKPGQYVITKPVLLGQAIAMAGGFDEERANPKKCLLTRG